MDTAVGEGRHLEPSATGEGGLSMREAALAELALGARGHAGRARAASTERGYAEDWTRFQLWCLDLNLDALPADPLTGALYLTHLAPAWRPATADDPPGAVVAGEVLERRGLAPGSIARHPGRSPGTWRRSRCTTAPPGTPARPAIPVCSTCCPGSAATAASRHPGALRRRSPPTSGPW